MYNSKYECIYMKDDLFQEEDKLSEESCEMIREEIYRNDILNIFDLEEYNDDIIKNKMDNIYNTLVKDIFFNTLLETLVKKFNLPDSSVAFILFFSFDYLYLAHPCICDYYDVGEITISNKENILRKINN